MFITRLLHNMTLAAQATTRNKAVVSDDIGVNLTSLTPLTNAVVRDFVPRLGANKGLLRVRLRLNGPDGLPGAAAIQVGDHACGLSPGQRHITQIPSVYGGVQ